jgi:serine phosphatase RsbU (regulator of sigma subunit)
MRSPRTRNGGTMVRRLSSRIELLQDAFRKLSRSAGITELGRKFAEVVNGVFPRWAIGVVHASEPGASWNLLAGVPPETLETIPALQAGDHSIGRLIEVPRGMLFLHRCVDHSTIGLAMTRPKGHPAFSDLDILSCRLFVQLFDNAYQEFLHRRKEKGLVFSLNHRILQLNSLIETGIEVARLDEQQSPHHLALVRAVALTNASRGSVRLKSGRKVVDEFVFPEGAIIDAGASSRITSSFTFMKEVCQFELCNKESRSGVQPFDETDQLLLDALARQVQAAMENRYLHRQELEKQSIERDLAVAASIQQKILPVALPAIPGYDLAGINIPSKSIGGDYYDCIPMADGRYAVVIADVAGKGISAALLVSGLHSYLSAYLEQYSSLPRLADQLNRAIFHDSTDDKFATALIVILDPRTGAMECLNAGHNPAYLLGRSGTVREFAAGGLPLGMLNMGLQYQSTNAVMNSGDSLFLYTDGVTEAANPKNEMFETGHPPADYLASHFPLSAHKFVDGLIGDIRKFTGPAPQADDITILFIRRL